MSDEYLSVDGSLIQAWASHKSFQPKGGPPSEGCGGRNLEVDFKDERRSNKERASTTDPDRSCIAKARTQPPCRAT